MHLSRHLGERRRPGQGSRWLFSGSRPQFILSDAAGGVEGPG